MTATNAKESDPLLPTSDNGRDGDSKSDASSANEMYGYLLIVLSSLFYSVMWIAIRYATAYRGIHVAATVFLRGASSVCYGLLVTFTCLDYKRVFILPWPILRKVILRGVLGSIAMTTHFFAIRLIPIGMATTIFFTSPILTILLSSFVLGERIGKREILAGILSFGGVILVADPFSEESLIGNKSNTLGLCLALLASAVGAATFTVLRSVAPQICFMSAVLSHGFCATTCGVLLGGSSIRELTRDSKGVIVTMIAGLTGFAGQCCFGEAYKYSRAGTGALMRNLDLPLVYLVAVLVLYEVPKLLSVFGSILVVSGSLILAAEAMKRR